MKKIKMFVKLNGSLAYLSPTVTSQGVGPGLIFSNTNYKHVFLNLGFTREYSVDNQVSDQDFIRIWPHRTRWSKHGRNASEEKIKEELILRGYILNKFGKWKKLSLSC